MKEPGDGFGGIGVNLGRFPGVIPVYPKFFLPAPPGFSNPGTFLFLGKVELHGKQLEIEHSVPKKQR